MKKAVGMIMTAAYLCTGLMTYVSGFIGGIPLKDQAFTAAYLTMFWPIPLAMQIFG